MLPVLIPAHRRGLWSYWLTLACKYLAGWRLALFKPGRVCWGPPAGGCSTPVLAISGVCNPAVVCPGEGAGPYLDMLHDRDDRWAAARFLEYVTGDGLSDPDLDLIQL